MSDRKGNELADEANGPDAEASARSVEVVGSREIYRRNSSTTPDEVSR